MEQPSIKIIHRENEYRALILDNKLLQSLPEANVIKYKFEIKKIVSETFANNKNFINYFESFKAQKYVGISLKDILIIDKTIEQINNRLLLLERVFSKYNHSVYFYISLLYLNELLSELFLHFYQHFESHKENTPKVFQSLYTVFLVWQERCKLLPRELNLLLQLD